jgi:hypothetical protein
MVNKDWVGNSNSVFKSLSANNHADVERENDDYYATDPMAIDVLLSVEKFNNNVWECASGEGHLSKRLKEFGYNVWSTDLIDRGYSDSTIDFLQYNKSFNGDIITNPPYKFAQEFVEKGIELTNNKLALFLKIQFLEGKGRRKLFDKYPPKTVYVSSSRILCAKNGDFEYMKNNGGSAVCYCWFVWEKNFIGDTVLKWVN